MLTTNAANSHWFLIHINLAKFAQEKYINHQKVIFQKNLPIGILLYGAGLEMKTTIPAQVESEVIAIRFNKKFLHSYFTAPDKAIDIYRSVAYEDLDDLLYSKLAAVLASMDERLKCHSRLLDFLNAFFLKLAKHEKPSTIERLHASDLNLIIKASVSLRDPLETQVPSLNELADAAGMGITKFKESFKLVFGKPPMQYRNRIRMEYAQEALQKKLKTASELSYELGYTHPSNFTAAYKRYFGVLPSLVAHSSFRNK